MDVNPVMFMSEFKSIYDRIDPEVKAIDEQLRRKKRLQA